MNHKLRSAASHLDTIRCGLYFTGQNLFYLLIYMYLNTYFTDVGIPVLAVAGIALAVRLLDACYGPLFYSVLYRIRSKKGVIPVLRLMVLLVPVTTVILFSIPYELSTGWKILWALLGYLLWDTAYTVCNAPMFGVEGAVTEIQQGCTVLSAVGRVCSMAAAIVLMVVIPSFRGLLGGWSATVAVLSIAGIISMLPGCIGKAPRSSAPDAQRLVSLRQIFAYLRGNRYLCVFYLAFMLTGTMNIASCLGLYLARHCLHSEAMLSVTGILTLIPGVLFGAFLPAITRRTDKFRLYYCAAIASVVMQLIRYFAGYENIPVYLLTTLLAAIPTGMTTSILFCFTYDCAEYGRYMGLDTNPALPYATQMFFTKLQSAGVTVLSCVALAAIGFTEGEGAVQVADFADQLWGASILIPAVGMIVSLMVLHQYDLRDHDVALMQMYNDGQISRKEAQRQLLHVSKPV